MAFVSFYSCPELLGFIARVSDSQVESLAVLLDRSYQTEIKDISVSDQQVTPTQKGPGWGAESG